MPSAPAPERRPAGEGPAGAGLARDVLWPFLWTRLALGAVAWLGAQVSASWSYPFPEAARRGWAFVPWLPLDAFGRWDAHWYLDLAARGYVPGGAPGAAQSSLAFFPLYPLLVRGADALVPAAWRGPGSLYLCAVLVSSAAAVAALALLVRFGREVTGDPAASSRAALLLLLFPTGFVLSAPYPESLFLLLTLASLRAGWHGRPGLAGALGALAALSRPGGALLAVPLAWMALSPPGGDRPRGSPLARLAPALLPAAGLALRAANRVADLWVASCLDDAGAPARPGNAYCGVRSGLSASSKNRFCSSSTLVSAFTARIIAASDSASWSRTRLPSSGTAGRPSPA